ncbi:MAG: hypothetical protein FD124_2512 [Alphaproteobacteria bacterium]|nr:MAG: hypothetical protein FD124_2512 [Alphaproteobacteria bacterium]
MTSRASLTVKIGSTLSPPRRSLRRLRDSTSISWIAPASGSITAHRSRVPAVAKIGPLKPPIISFGSNPL